MIREEIRQLETGKRELRKFGLLVGAVFTLLGVWFWWRGKGRYPYFLAPGAVLVVLGTVAPRVLRLIYVGWMSLAFLLGFAVSNILLTLFFYVIVTPVGLLARLWAAALGAGAVGLGVRFLLAALPSTRLAAITKAAAVFGSLPFT